MSGLLDADMVDVYKGCQGAVILYNITKVSHASSNKHKHPFRCARPLWHG